MNKTERYQDIGFLHTTVMKYSRKRLPSTGNMGITLPCTSAMGQPNRYKCL